MKKILESFIIFLINAAELIKNEKLYLVNQVKEKREGVENLEECFYM